jgi:hypothetical protein
VRRLQRGTEKYKGKLPFKCFNCGEVGHFATKFPHNKNRDNKDKDNFNSNERRKGKTQRNKYFQKQKKNLYSKEDDYLSSESDEEIEGDVFSWLKKQSLMKMKTIIVSHVLEKMKMWMLILKDNYSVP